ncbi:MAG: flagellar FlbD family protein [Oscillospiraceae bacterium]
MVILTKLSGQPFALNCDMMESITENPDTTILLSNGKIYIVAESMADVIAKITDYKQRLLQKTN